MSADKPIQRYDANLHYAGLGVISVEHPRVVERDDGDYVKYADHLAAIRNARAGAFEEGAVAAETLSESEKEAFGDGMEHDDRAIRLRRKVRARGAFAGVLRALAAKERTTLTDEPPRSYGNSYGEWQS